MNIGDKVRNIKDGKIGIVIRIFENGSISVLEKVSPVVINTHDNEKTLELVEQNSVSIFDERENNTEFLLTDALSDLKNVIKNEGNLKVDRIILTKDEFKVVIDHKLYDVNDYKNNI